MSGILARVNAPTPNPIGWHAPPNTPRWIGLDIGGANLKASDGRGRSESIAFPLWQRPDELTEAIGRLLADLSDQQVVGVAMTMTGELADCYQTKAEGVRAIVGATESAAGALPVRIASTQDRWLTPQKALAEPIAVAAANWRLAARLVALNHVNGNGLWIDTGSTTTDIIPITDGRVTPRGLTDPQRLAHGELVYTGVRRTPVCAVVDRLPYEERECPVAAEWFATTADAWLLLDEIAEDGEDHGTADGRPLTKRYAIDRLARCVCADRDGFSEQDARLAAERIAEAQVSRLAPSLSGRELDWIVVGGEGEFLARRAVRSSWAVAPESVSDRVGRAASRCLPAHAAAVLAAIELGTEA